MSTLNEMHTGGLFFKLLMRDIRLTKLYFSKDGPTILRDRRVFSVMAVSRAWRCIYNPRQAQTKGLQQAH